MSESYFSPINRLLMEVEEGEGEGKERSASKKSPWRTTKNFSEASDCSCSSDVPRREQEATLLFLG